MEQEKRQLCKNFLRLPRTISCQIVSFLSLSDLQQLEKALRGATCAKSEFIDFVSLKYFLIGCLNLTDRSIYLSFYNDPQYLRIEQTHTNNLDYSMFSNYHSALKRILEQMTHELVHVQSADQIIASIEQTLKDPQLPIPKMRKNGQAMFCNSSFQFFLADRHYQNEEAYFDECFEDLNNYSQASLDSSVKSLNENAVDQIGKIREVRKAAYTLTGTNYKEYLVEGCFVHNTVTCCMALVQDYVEMVQAYINSFEDSLFRFMEFTLRYCIFRNVVLALQEKLSNVFVFYNQFCKSVIPEGQSLPEVTLWRSAMTIWHEKMKPHHGTNNAIYYYLLTKHKNRTLLQNLTNTLSEFQSTQIFLRNKLEMQEFQIQLKDNFYCHDTTDNYGIETYFTKDLGLFAQVLRQYTEYKIDISINEFTVHWCGHSKQQLDKPYLAFETQVVECSRAFYNYLARILGEDRQHKTQTTSHNFFSLKKIFQSELETLSSGLFKSTTLKKIVEQQNKVLVEFRQKNEISDHYDCGLLTDQFEDGDDLLLHSNTKHGIQFNSSLTSQQKENYSFIAKHWAKPMIKSTETTDSLRQEGDLDGAKRGID